MRVVGGSAKGKRLFSVPGTNTRPILDRVKTALFDILRPSLESKTFLDLFSGTGSVGIEALSQGGKRSTFIDIDSKAISIIKKNLLLTDLTSKAEVRHTDAFSFLRKTRQSYDFIFIAPPQYQTLWLQALQHIAERPSLVNEGGVIIVQIDPREYEEVFLTEFEEEDKRKYGNTLLVFYRRAI